MQSATIFMCWVFSLSVWVEKWMPTLRIVVVIGWYCPWMVVNYIIKRRQLLWLINDHLQRLCHAALHHHLHGSRTIFIDAATATVSIAIAQRGQW